LFTDNLEKNIHPLQCDRANFEHVRKFVLLDTQVSVEEGKMTPTLKIKRKVIEKRYEHLIEDMYENIA